MNLNLNGKNVLVTGGTRGIGAGFINAFADASAFVYVTGTNQETLNNLNKEASAQSKSVKYLYCDFSLEDSTKQFLQTVSV